MAGNRQRFTSNLGTLPGVQSAGSLASAKLRRPLSTPTLQAPVPNNTLSQALAALSGTLKTAGDIKKFKYDREQDLLFKEGEQALEAPVNDFINDAESAIRKEIAENQARMANGDQPLVEIVKNRINKEFMAEHYKGWNALSEDNKEKLLNKIQTKQLVAAGNIDRNLREFSEQQAYGEVTEKLNARLAAEEGIVSTDGTFDPYYKQTIKEYVSTVTQQFAVKGPEYVGTKIDAISNSIVKKLLHNPAKDAQFIENPQAAKMVGDAIKDAFTNGKGENILSTSAIANIDNAVGQYVKSSKDAQTRFSQEAFKGLAGDVNAQRSTLGKQLREDNATNNSHNLGIQMRMLDLAKLEANYIKRSGGSISASLKAEITDLQAAVSADQFIGQVIHDPGSLEMADPAWNDPKGNTLTRAIIARDQLMAGESSLASEKAIKKLTNLIATKSDIQGILDTSFAVGTFKGESLEDIASVVDNAARYGSVNGVKLPEDMLNRVIPMLSEERQNPGTFDIDKDSLERLTAVTVNALPAGDSASRFILMTGRQLPLNEASSAPGEILSSGEIKTISIGMFGALASGAMETPVNKLAGLAHAQLYEEDRNGYKADWERVNNPTLDKDVRNKAQHSLRMKMKHRMAQLAGRRYIRFKQQEDMFVSDKLAPSVADNELSAALQTSEVMATNLMFGSGIRSFLDSEQTFIFNPANPIFSQRKTIEQYRKDLNSQDWTGTNGVIKNEILRIADTSKDSAEAQRRIGNLIADMRESSTVVTDQNGQVRFQWIPVEGAPVQTTKPMNFSQIQNLNNNEEALELQRRIAAEEGDEALLDEIGVAARNYIDLIAFGDQSSDAAALDLPFSVPVREFAGIPRTTKVLMESVDWDNAPSIDDKDPNHPIKIHTDGNFRAVNIEYPLKSRVNGAKAVDLFGDPKNSDVKRSSVVGSDQAHMMTRSVGATMDLPTGTFDHPKLLDHAGSIFNRFVQEEVEAPIRQELRSFLLDNFDKEYTANWTVGTYSDKAWAIGKKRTLRGRKIDKTNQILALTSKLQVFDAEGNMVKEWEWEVEDKNTLDFFNQTQLMNP